MKLVGHHESHNALQHCPTNATEAGNPDTNRGSQDTLQILTAGPALVKRTAKLLRYHAGGHLPCLGGYS